MSVVIERSGAQLLPFREDQRHKVTMWNAQCAIDADLRTVSKAYRDIASELVVQAVAS
jgi:hypothetical protein